ncbi:breast cancer type 1 susceptibility protein [Bufo gargarizans]|uniref:breast cancer type 1 susceptibility protein n=1 Tax=Bufo gargarizans TaxID=30331 RepID=UPI001CF59689|nr:breast cancer type 1 susceptibility protein [Bufo gargarizans]
MTCATMDVEDIHNVLSVMQKNLECPICLDLMKEPVATRCDHIFCRFCMLQLLGKKKKGRAECPLCKKEVTKRSLQDSPRFKLLVNGLLKIINAFELDSGYKFFPSQDYASTVAASHKETLKKDDQPVVQSTGYRNRTRRGILNGGPYEDHLSLLETSADTPLARDADTWNCKQPKRQKKDTKQLITDLVSDSSEDDLFKRAGSLGSFAGEPNMSCEPLVSLDSEKKEDSPMANEATDQVPSKLESEDVAASDLAEYGFSERDLESLRSNLLSIEGVRTLRESPSEKSAVVRDPLLSDKDFCQKVGEQGSHRKLDENVGSSKLTEHNARMQMERQPSSESQTLKIAIDFQYDREDSTPENMGSTQGSPRDASCAVSRERVKKSIKKVNEWLLKTDDLLYNSRDVELLTDVSQIEDPDASDKASNVSDETEIMAVSHRHVVADAVEKSMVSAEDRIFGRVYKREKKPSLVGKVTCVADVHVDGVGGSLKVNEVPKIATLKPKRSAGLLPEHFIKRVDEKEGNDDSIVSGAVVVDDFGLDVEISQLKASNALLDADKIEVIGPDLETFSDAQSNKPKKQKKPLKRKSEKTKRTQMIQTLHLTKGTDVDSCQQQSPHLSEVKIDSYPSSTELGHEVNQKNVRRSKRLNLFKENDFPFCSNQMVAVMNIKDNRAEGPPIQNPPDNMPTLVNCEEPCLDSAVLEDPGPQINGKSPDAVQNGTIVVNGSSHMKCDSPHVAREMCNGSSPMPKQDAEPVVNAVDVEDSDLDTQLLLKTFKSAKRMSFKLDPVTETANNDNCDLMDICEINTSLTNKQGKNEKCKSEENQCNGQEIQPEHSRKLRSKKNSRLSSKHNGMSSAENTESVIVLTTKTIKADDVEPLENCNPAKNAAVSKIKGSPLLLETETISLYPIVTHQNSAAAKRGDTRSRTAQGENEQAKNDCYQNCSFDEEQANQITSSNSSQGSWTGKLLGHAVSHNRSPEVDSETPDGLLGSVDGLQKDTSYCAVAEKSFVFGADKKSQLLDRPVSPVIQSQVVRSRKRRVQKLESSEEESSGDEELPCLNILFGNASTVADPKNTSASSSPKQQGGGVLAMFSSCSTSSKTQTSFNLPRNALVCSQESQCSVNLFSSQSNTSDHSMNGATGTHNQHRTQESSPKRARVEVYGNEDKMTNLENEGEEMTIVENDCEDPCQEHNLGDVSGCDSEASHTGDSSGLSSQCEILNTQQREAMRNNLDNLQREMAALEAVLEQRGSQSPASGRKQASTVEHVTKRPQEAQEKQADDEAYQSPDAIPETAQGAASGRQSTEHPPPVGIRSRSPTPPLSLPQMPSRKETPEKICASFNVFKELKESTLTDDESMGQKGDVLHAHESVPDCAPPASSLKNSKSPKRSLRSKLQAANSHSTFSRGSTRQSPQQSSKQPSSTPRSSSPTFSSPLRSKVAPSVKSPVVSRKRNYCLVTSGLSQGEVILVQKFARKTQSIFSSQMSELTTHVIMKTDEHLVCERTLKYFLGVAGRKWVVSYEWIEQSFREGRILDEYDFEVKGDVINGKNHRGPRRSRLGSDGLLLTDFEICCLGSFKDMARDDLECMVSLCGASVARDPSQFEHKSGMTSLVVVQPDKETDYPAMRKKYRCLVITREWVLDSVSSYKLQAFDSYLM